MNQRTDRIRGQIDEEPVESLANLDELGTRMRSASNWRRRFWNNPMLGLGLAFGGGLLLATLLRSTPRDNRPYTTANSDRGRGLLSNAWEAIQVALIGGAANRVTDVLVELVPDFREQLAKVGYPAKGGNGPDVQGEGNYEAARRYRAGVERYVHSADIAAAARAAEPRSESEAEELEAAEDEGRSRVKPS